MSTAQRLATRDIAVWAGDNYACELMKRFGLDDTGGAVRVSLVLYNNEEDVDRLVEAVSELRAMPKPTWATAMTRR